MAAKRDIEKAVKLKEFQRAVYKLLTVDDQDYLFYAMKEYNTYHSVGKLMLALNSCLDSAEKLDLLPYIRDLIPKHDLKRFDSLAPYNRMAHPITIEKPRETFHEALQPRVEPVEENTRIIRMQRTKDASLGFSIRGGQEHDLGIYISHVESFSPAEKAGLKVGDQVIKVNNIDFERVSHSSAVLVLTSHDNLKIEVKNVGHIPGQDTVTDNFVWVDTNGKHVGNMDDKESQRKVNHSPSRDKGSADRLLSSSSKHKIVLHSSKKRPLGFSIRGGSEYGLGIYISEVDKDSPSDQAGLRVGDQILDINGHSFYSILHYEAVHILRSYDTLIMTLKSLGRLPVLQSSKEERKERSQSFGPTSSLRKPSELFKPLSSPKTSKRPSNDTIMEEDEEEEEEREEEQQKRPRSSSMTVQSNKQRASSAPSGGSSDEVDGSSRPRSSLFASSSFRSKKPIMISPLATHEARASPVPQQSPITSPLRVKSKFFEKGIGTQVMLASQTSHSEQLLFDKARRILRPADVEILREDLDQYDDNGDVKQLVDCLVSIFNTSEKMELLQDIRSLIKPLDIAKFDELISPHEVRALQQKTEDGDSSDTVSIEYEFDYTDDLNENAENQVNGESTHEEMTDESRGQNGLMSDFMSSREKSASLDMNAKLQLGLNKDATRASAPELSEVRTKETNLSWYDSEDSDEMESQPPTGVGIVTNRKQKGHSYPFREGRDVSNSVKMDRKMIVQPNPVVVEVAKDAPSIGLAIEVTHDNRVVVKDVRPGGAIDKNNFIKPGFEIVQVDNIRIRGKSYHDAAREIADTFKTDGPTVQFIVIPNYF